MRISLAFLLGAACGAAAVIAWAPGGRKILGHARTLARGKVDHLRHRTADVLDAKVTHVGNVVAGRTHQVVDRLRG